MRQISYGGGGVDDGGGGNTGVDDDGGGVGGGDDGSGGDYNENDDQSVELFHLPLSQKNEARPASLGGNFDIFLRRHRDNE